MPGTKSGTQNCLYSGPYDPKRWHPSDRLAALVAGAADIIPKPVDDATLLARVRNLLRLRGVEEELQMRHDTAFELGFHEAKAPFAGRAKVLLIDDQLRAYRWRNALDGDGTFDVTIMTPSQALEALRKGHMSPDIVLLTATAGDARSGLTLLAEIRSCGDARHPEILVWNQDNDQNLANAAMDMGANDVLYADACDAEFLFRLRRQLQRKQKSDQLRNTLTDGLKLAVTDPLTGLFNRRYALPHLTRIAEKSRATNSAFAVMVLDIDRFKRINDTYGHAGGDSALVEIARRLKSNIRSIDMIARIGGEEFPVVMPDTDISAARGAAERLRRIIRALPVRIGTSNDRVGVTISIGVSIGGKDGQHCLNAANVIDQADQADQALLGAKSRGRNTVTFGKSAA